MVRRRGRHSGLTRRRASPRCCRGWRWNTGIPRAPRASGSASDVDAVAVPGSPWVGGSNMLAPMIDHITLTVTNYARSKAFYEKTLAPLGIKLIVEYGVYGGFGLLSNPFFWIGAKAPDFWTAAHKAGMSPTPVAFNAKGRATVDPFYAAGIAAGAKDNGPPGPRALYHPHYYGAFVLDPDGNNIEAVCHSPA